MDTSRAAAAAAASSNYIPINPHLILNQEELPSPTPSTADLAAQQPSHMEIEAPTAAVSSKSKAEFTGLYELSSSTTSPALLPAQQPRPMEIETEASPSPLAAHLAAQQPCPMEIEAPIAVVSSKVIVESEEIPVTNPTLCPMRSSVLDASSSKPKFTMPRTVEDIFQDFSARRDAFIRALTTEQEEFFDLYGPAAAGRKPLLLYGHADGNWEVSLPEEEAPPQDMPEPAAGLNFVRDKMTRFDWLSLVAVRADSWLAGLPRFFGAYLDANQRMRLFDMMNDLPTIYETFVQFHDSIWLPANMPPSPDLMHNIYEPNNSSRSPAEENVPLSSYLMMQNVSNPNKDSSTHAEENVPISPGIMQNVSNQNNDSSTHGEETDVELEEVSDQTFCAACNARYHANGFWICCDICDRWFHGKCVKISASEAEQMYQYKCPDCKLEEIGE